LFKTWQKFVKFGDVTSGEMQFSMSKIKIQLFLRLFLGLMFLFSGVSKLIPIEAFETVTVQQGLMSWGIVPYFSRSMIGFELFLGFLFLFNVKMNRFTLPASFILLIVFTIYLLILEVGGSGGENCGCFGEIIPMTGIQSIIKNIVFLIIIIYLYLKFGKSKDHSTLFVGSAYLFILILMPILFPITPYEVINKSSVIIAKDSVNKQKEIIEKIKLDTATEQKEKKEIKLDTAKKKIEPIKPKLSEKYPSVVSIYSLLVPNADFGIKIVAFLSLDCDHCITVATELNSKNGALNGVQRYYLFLGSQEAIEPFFSKTGGEVSYSLLTPQKFYPHLSSAPPKLILLVNGNVVSEMEGENVNVNEIITKIKELNSNF
jgi:uncharacterized membrane protein YphA (DoxX/SURF4 family)